MPDRVKEKLVELLENSPYLDVLGGLDYYEEAAKELIANGVTVVKDNDVPIKWISVKDRLPTREDANETESILAINKDENYVGRWIWDIVARWPSEFTYWMPLPQPPKEQQHKHFPNGDCT